MAGTSGTKKLGIRQGHAVVLLNAPTGFERSLDVADTVRVSHQLRFAPADVVVFFVDSIPDLERRFGDIAARLHPQGGLWVAWRHRRPGRITHETIRRIGLAAGMVDNKECAIDAIEAHYRELIARPAASPALAAAIRNEVEQPLGALADQLGDDPSMPGRLRGRLAAARRYLDARRDGLRLYVQYLETGDTALRNRIVEADHAVDAALELLRR